MRLKAAKAAIAANKDRISTPAGEKTRKTDEKPEPDQALVRRAIQDLGLDTPYYTCRIVGNRLEFTLYGGSLVYWPPVKGAK